MRYLILYFMVSDGLEDIFMEVYYSVTQIVISYSNWNNVFFLLEIEFSFLSFG